MTPRVRWVQPPDNWVPQSGHCSTTCSTRWVGVMRVRAKPWRPAWPRPLGRAGFRSVLGSRPGIRREPLGSACRSKLGNPLLQPVNDDLLPDDDANEDISMGSPEIGFGNHASYMT